MIFPVRGLFLAAVLFPAIVFAGNVNRITYQGRILKPDGSPVKAVTNFRFTIRSSNECILWTEVLSVDLSVSSGAFTAIVGDGVNTASGGHQFREIFDNTTTLTGLSGCISGSTYGAGLADDRVLEVSFNDGSGSQNLPAIAIKSVPFANFAQKSASTSTLLDKKLSSVSQPTVDGQVLKYDLGTDSWIAGPAGSLGVTFVGIGLPPSIFSNGAGVSSSGTLSATLVSQSPNTVFAAPTGTGGGTPLFRNLVASDIPGLPASQLTAGTLGAERGGTGIDGSMAADGQILIGNGTGFSLGTLSAGSNISISNSPGGIQISATHTLATTGVVAGSYGSSTYIPSFTVDSYGRLTSAGSVAVSIPASMTSLNGLTAPDQVFAIGSSGTVAAFTSAGSIHTLNIPAASGVGVAGGLLSNDDYLIIMNGTIPAARIAGLSAAHITSGTFASARLGIVDAANGGTGLDGSAAGIGQLLMGNGSGYTLGSLAAGSNISITNTNGTITIASSNSGGTVTYIDTGAGLVGGGFSTVGTISLGTTGVAAGSYGSATYIPTMVVDQYGRITSAGSVSVNSSQWTDVALGINYGSGGSVGIGVASPIVKLDIDGAIKIANDSATCAAGFAGAIRYNTGVLQYCDGVTAGWVTLGISGSGLQNLNGLNANAQLFAINTSGTVAAITSAGSTHTVSVPMASTTNAAGGLISNSDYLTLMNGTIPVSRVAGAGTLNSAVMSVTAGTGLDGGTITSNGTISLGTSGVAAGYYGGASFVPNFTVDSYGRVTSVGSTAIAIDASAITSGTLATARFGTTGVSAGSYGSSNYVPTFSVDAQGRLINAGSVAVASSGGTVQEVVAGAGLSGGTISTFGTISLPTTGVTAGSTGTASFIPTFIVDAYGRLTGRGSVAVAIDASAITSGTLSLATVGTIPVSQVAGAGTLNSAVMSVTAGSGLDGGTITSSGTISLGTTGVASGVYGSSTHIPTLTVDAFGRLTSAGSVAVNSSQWTNIALGINYGSGGSVGIGVASPIVKLDIDGAIKIANDSATCAAGFAGAIRYNGGLLQYCDGVTAGWVTLGVSGSGLQNLNGLNANAQLFAINTSGTVVAITSAGSTHTFSVPMASTTNAAGGLISNSDYLTLMNGTIPVSRVAGAGTLNSAVMSVTAGSGLDGGTITSSGTISLGTTGVTAATYGNAAYVSNIGVDQYGRVTSMGSTAIAIDATQITSGTLATARFGTTGVSAGSYGSSNYVPTFSVDAQGRLTNAGSVAVASSGGTVQEVVAGAGLSGGTISTFGTISLPTTGVTAGSTGTASFIPTFIVDAYGRLTGRGSVAVAIDASAITSGTLSLATVGTIPVSQVAGAGTLNSAVMSVTAGTGLDGGTITSSGTISLGTTGVAAGVYGSSTHIPTLTVDAFGRLTSAGSVAVNSSQWTNIALGINYGSGSVGIGVASPVVKLDIDGAIKIANDSATCAAGFAGAIRYNGGLLQYCDGVTAGWVTLGVSGSGLQNLNGLNANAQLFAINTSGTVVAITSAGSTHTVSIPMASTTNAVGGLISNSDYLTLMNGTIPVSRVAGAGTLNSAVMSVTAGSGLDGGTITSSGTIALATTGVTAGTVGSSGWIPQIGFDIYGRIVSMGSTALSLSGLSGTLDVSQGGTGLNASSAANGQLLIGNGSGFTLGTLNNSNGILITNGSGVINIATNAQTTNATLSIVSRDMNGSFAANKGTFNSIDLNNAGAFVTIQNPAAANYTLTLPANMGSAGQVLQTNGTSATTWVSAPVNGGVMLAASGNVGTPGISFLADSNTGLYNPGDGTIGFSSNGTMVMRIDPSLRTYFFGDTSTEAAILYTNNLISTGGRFAQQNANALNYFAGSLAVGTSSNPTAPLDVNGLTRTQSLAVVGSGTMTLLAPLSGNNSLRLPATMGTLNQALVMSGVGTLGWATVGDGSVTYPLLSTTRGSVGTPAYSFSADTDTGLYSPGANTLAISTAGTARIAVDHLGNVGIGNENPLSLLTIGQASGYNTSPRQTITINSDGIANPSAAGSDSAGDKLILWNESGEIKNALGIGSTSQWVQFSGTGGSYQFWGGTAAAPAEVMRVNSSGDVGIGTSAISTGTRLEVTGGAIKAGNRGEMRFGEILAQGANYVGLRAPGTLASDVVWTLPATDGSSGQVLSTDGTGNLSWTTASSGVTFPLLSTTLGSVATPAYSFSADTDTGLYSPGANTLAISTGGTARITVDNSGYVGIGTTNPTARLELKKNTEVLRLINDGVWSSDYLLLNNGVSDVAYWDNNALANLNGAASAPSYSFIGNGQIGMFNGGSGRLSFATSQAERLSITAAGSVGIGTTSPSANLSVVANSGSLASSLNLGNAGGGGVRIAFDNSLLQDTPQAYMGVLRTNSPTNLDGDIYFTTRGNGAEGERLRINSGGSVGVGTITPQALLDVNGSSRSTSVTIAGAGTATLLPPTAGNNSWRLPATAGTMGQALVLSGVGTLGWSTISGGTPTFPLLSTTLGSVATPAYSFSADSDTGLYSPGANTLAISTGGTARVTLDGQGYVGIGTDLPNSILDVVSSGAPVLTVRSTASNANSALYLIGRNGGVDNTGIIYAGQGGEIVMRPASGAYITLQDGAANNRLNISNAGHVTLNGLSARATGSVGIGTTSPSQKLDVNGGLALSGAGTAALLPPTAGINSWTLPATAGTMGQALVLSSAGTLGWSDLGGGITFPLLSTTRGSVGTPVYSFSADSDTGLFSPGANTLAISTGGTARFTVASDGKIGIGTDSPTQLLEVAGTSRAWVWEAGPGSSTNPSFSFSAGNYGVFFPGGTATALTTNGIERMRILSTGQVGIGTQAPDANAVLTLTALTEPKMTIRATGTNANAYIGLVARGSSTDNEAVIYADSGGNLVMRPSSVSENFIVRNGADSLTRFFVSGSTGSVGVGTTSPQALLDVNGSTRVKSLTIASGTGTVGLNVATTGNYSMTLPSTIGSPGQVLATDGTGALSWITSSGTPTFPLLSTTLGSVATPAYSFSADTDTGLYSPGANTLAISTAGTARLAIDHLGNVGIGSSSPTSILDIVANGAPTLTIRSAAANANSGIDLVGRSSSTNYTASIWAGQAGELNAKPASGAYMALQDGSGNERLGIGSDGNVYSNGLTARASGSVGVGTTTPQALFEVAGASRSQSHAYVGSGTMTLLAPLSGNNSLRLPATMGTLNQALVMSGVGTLGWATLGGSSITYPLLSTTRGSVGTPAYSFNGDSDTGIYSPAANAIAITAGGVDKFFVNAGGSIGIGTTTPSGAVEVSGGSTASGAGGATYIRGQAAGPGGNDGGSVYIQGGDRTGSNENGKVILNSVTEVWKSLKIMNGSGEGSYSGSGTLGSTPYLLMEVGNNSNSNASIMGLRNRNSSGTDQYGFLGVVPTNASYTPSIVFGQQTGANSWSERMRVTSEGALAIGTTATASNTLLEVAGGVTASSTYEGVATAYVTSGTGYSIPDTNLNIRRITLSNNTTLRLPAYTAGAGVKMYQVTIFLKQDATGGRTITWLGNGSDTIKWDTNVAPTIVSAPNKITIIQLMKPSDETVWYGSLVWQEQ